MKFSAIFFSMLCFSQAFAAVELEKLSGDWKNLCSQAQMNGKQGFITEVYSFNESSAFAMKREWFKEAGCSGDVFAVDEEQGTLKIGKENTNNGFNPQGTYDADFDSAKGVDKGLIWISGDYSKLRLSRGFGGDMRNTMLGLFEYKKQ